MNTLQRQRATARNSRPILKTLFGIMAILLLLSIISMSYTYYTTNIKKNYEIIGWGQWYVVAGDTVSEISKIFTPTGYDYRIIQQQIMEKNEIKGHLQIGQIIEVPIYNEVN